MHSTGLPLTGCLVLETLVLETLIPETQDQVIGEGLFNCIEFSRRQVAEPNGADLGTQGAG